GILDQVLESVELQHVCEEGPSAVLESRRSNHPRDLLLESILGMDRAATSRREKLGVRRRIPKNERQPRCFGIPIQPVLPGTARIGFGHTNPEEKLRSH